MHYWGRDAPEIKLLRLFILRNVGCFGCFLFISVLVCQPFRSHAVDSAQLIIKVPLAVIKCSIVNRDLSGSWEKRTCVITRPTRFSESTPFTKYDNVRGRQVGRGTRGWRQNCGNNGSTFRIQLSETWSPLRLLGLLSTHLCEFWKIALTICHTNGSFTKSQTYFSFSLVEALFSESTWKGGRNTWIKWKFSHREEHIGAMWNQEVSGGRRLPRCRSLCM